MHGPSHALKIALTDSCLKMHDRIDCAFGETVTDNSAHFTLN
jgi:hypothetical protein